VILHYLQHVPFEGIGNIETWAQSSVHTINSTRLYADEKLPSPDAFDLLIVMGGPMNVYEENAYPFLIREKRFIEQAIQNGKSVLGICLGSQLLATVLGAKVFKNKFEEIGWFPVEKTDEAKAKTLLSSLPERFTTFHWHGDTFEIPHGAKRIYKSEACANQGFIYGDKIIGLQFHPEVDETTLKLMIENEGDGITVNEFVQSPQTILEQQNFKANAGMLATLLDEMTKTIRLENKA